MQSNVNLDPTPPTLDEAPVPQPQFEPQWRFVSAQNKESGRGVQGHIQKEVVRKKRWSKKVKQALEAKEARNSFRHFVDRTKKDATTGSSENDLGIGEAAEDWGSVYTIKQIEDIVREGLRKKYGFVENRMALATSERRYPDPTSLLGAGRTNPFGTWPVEVRGLDEFIDDFLCLDYRAFGLETAASFHPVRDLAFRCAMDNATSLQAVAAYAAVSLAPLQNPGKDALTLKAKALRMVNERLIAVDDSLIYAVTVLWMLEASHGAPEARQWHAKAVQRMVKSRGGYEALCFNLQMQIAWCIITMPDPMNLGGLSDDMYLHAYFIQLASFSERVDVLASSRYSPYPSEAAEFAKHAYLNDLLFGRVERRGSFKAIPGLYNLCRLTVLLYIHALILDYHHFSETLKSELQQLRLKLSSSQTLERHISLEGLALTIFVKVTGNAKAIDHPERAVFVLGMITFAKLLSVKSVENLLILLSGYLGGRRYEKSERLMYWNVEQMEKEAFGVP